MCSPANDDGKLIFYCHNVNLNSITFLNSIEPYKTVLENWLRLFGKDSMSYVEFPFIFQFMANYAILLHLVSACNQTIPTQWHKVKHHLSRLHIRDSDIIAIEPNAFNTDAFKQLYYLEFDSMHIKWFSHGMFNGLISLKVFVLRNLHLYTFGFNPPILSQNPAQLCHGLEFQLEHFVDFC